MVPSIVDVERTTRNMLNELRSTSASGLAVQGLMQAELAEHRQVFEALASMLAVPFAASLEIIEGGLRGGGKLLLFGNGGSAADAQHIAAELVVRYRAERRAIGAIALTTDTSTLTACANDLGFESIFERQIEAIGRAGDVAVGISTSGKSPNVLAGLRRARALGLSTIGLSGAEGGELPVLCDALICVPSPVTARIQEMHILIGHMWCKILERRLGWV
jgi:D-sedoheptulose 7-phosphate isomerase